MATPQPSAMLTGLDALARSRQRHARRHDHGSTCPGQQQGHGQRRHLHQGRGRGAAGRDADRAATQSRPPRRRRSPSRRFLRPARRHLRGRNGGGSNPTAGTPFSLSPSRYRTPSATPAASPLERRSSSASTRAPGHSPALSRGTIRRRPEPGHDQRRNHLHQGRVGRAASLATRTGGDSLVAAVELALHGRPRRGEHLRDHGLHRDCRHPEPAHDHREGRERQRRHRLHRRPRADALRRRCLGEPGDRADGHRQDGQSGQLRQLPTTITFANGVSTAGGSLRALQGGERRPRRNRRRASRPPAPIGSP